MSLFGVGATIVSHLSAPLHPWNLSQLYFEKICIFFSLKQVTVFRAVLKDIERQFEGKIGEIDLLSRHTLIALITTLEEYYVNENSFNKLSNKSQPLVSAQPQSRKEDRDQDKAQPQPRKEEEEYLDDDWNML
jgi:hypothetical protein